MRKLILGMSAMALVASAAAFADDDDPTRLAAAENPSATFAKLDADADGRISAIEAASNSKVAAGFTTADADKDGYLSKSEYAQMAASMSRQGSSQSQRKPNASAPEPAVPSDSSETAPPPQ